MKTNALRWFTIAAAVFSLTACTLDDDKYDPSIMNPSALVTVKPTADGSNFVMQVDDKTVVHAVNLQGSPFGTKEVRALVNYRTPKDSEIQQGNTYVGAENVYVNWIDSILTKKTIPTLGTDDDTFGNDPVEIVNDWTTVVEDGYITLRFRTYWGSGTIHKINLITGTDPEDPYKVVLHHDANGDYYGQSGDALVAFRLSELPDTAGQTVDLTLEWQSFSGKKTAKFKYCTRAQ
jgi:hypothetical protein